MPGRMELLFQDWAPVLESFWKGCGDMTKKEATKKLHKIYSILKDDEVRVKLNRKLPKGKGGRRWFGMVDPEDDGIFTIHVNPWRPWKSRGGFVSTVLHECLHLAYWDLDEKGISILEKEMFEVLSDRQLGNLMKRVFNLVRKE